MKSEIGLIGLGVMGKSLSRNLARNGFKLSVYNRHVDEKEENVAANFKGSFPELNDALAFDKLEDFVKSLELPRKIILMVNAGAAVDSVLTDLNQILDPKDIIIDAGNSHFEESTKRMNRLKENGIYLIGTGVSGGEFGALNGPSVMPSGELEAYKLVQKYLESISAKDSNNHPCCTYVGTEGSGHFVKMIHNGIEYVEMQLLAECYFIMKNQKLSNEQIADELEKWSGVLNSYLLSITIDILRKKEGDVFLLDNILDKAANKGTGKWATMVISDSGQSSTLIPAALFARYLSFFKSKREMAAALFSEELNKSELNLNHLKQAYFFSRVINHHQGFELINNVSTQNQWNINLSEIARIWTEGCIVKSDLMKDLVQTLKNKPSIMYQEPWTNKLKESYSALQSVVLSCIKNQVYIPCMLEALNYFNGLKTAESSANLIQAQRDFFGAHTYKKKNDPSETNYHTQWGDEI